jgi:MFS family permease
LSVGIFDIVLPATLFVGPLIKKFEGRNILISSMFVLLAGLLIRIDYQYIKKEDGNLHQSIYQYIAGSILILAGGLACESCAISIMAEVSSPIISLGLLNAGLVSGFGATLGRALGNIFLGITAAIVNTESISLYMYTGYSFAFVVLTIITLTLYRRMEKLSYAQQYISDSTREPQVDDSKSIHPSFQPNPEQQIPFSEIPH